MGTCRSPVTGRIRPAPLSQAFSAFHPLPASLSDLPAGHSLPWWPAWLGVRVAWRCTLWVTHERGRKRAVSKMSSQSLAQPVC